MVWPIFISVAVMPRISADNAACGSIRQAMAPSAPTPVTKRIGIPPFLLCLQPPSRGRGAAGIWLRRAGRWHGRAEHANPYSTGGNDAERTSAVSVRNAAIAAQTSTSNNWNFEKLEYSFHQGKREAGTDQNDGSHVARNRIHTVAEQKVDCRI